MGGKIKAGNFYVCEYPIGLGGVLIFIVKVLKDPYKKASGDIAVDIISPFGYINDELDARYFLREATEKEIEDFRNGKGLII